ncbi:hypothetical protein OFN09_30530, partial [Escherichia coli]|nr:hypothetical protein [Escherichia coli]
QARRSDEAVRRSEPVTAPAVINPRVAEATLFVIVSIHFRSNPYLAVAYVSNGKRVVSELQDNARSYNKLQLAVAENRRGYGLGSGDNQGA